MSTPALKFISLVVFFFTAYGSAWCSPGPTQMQTAYAAMDRGDYVAAQTALDHAFDSLSPGDNLDRVEIQAARGANLTLQHQWTEASAALADALSAAERLNDVRSKALVLGNRANLELARHEPAAALQTGLQAEQLAGQTNDPTLEAKIQTNNALAAVVGHDDRAADLNRSALESVSRIDPTPQRAFLLLTLASNEQQLAALRQNESTLHLASAYQGYQQAIDIGRTLHLPRIVGDGSGMLGGLYESAGRYDDAIKLTRQAIFSSQENHQPATLYRWQWQLARLMQKRGDDINDVIAAYQRAVATLQPIRADVSIGLGNRISEVEAGRSAFRETAGDLYRQLADLLLQRASQEPEPQANADLFAARDTMESLKTAELEDYFQTDCATINRAKLADIDKLIDDQTAAVYIIPLQGRTELLVSLSGPRIVRVSSPVGHEQLMKTARQFRLDLEDRTAHAYMLSGKQLYDWLIVPLQSVLSQRDIKTLVFISDEDLRSIPMSALWDGNDFLIAHFAVANAPGLTLMRTDSLSSPMTALLAGLTESAQGYPALRSVGRELSQISALYHSPPLLDGRFTKDQLQRDLDAHRYGIVHIATHGEFKPDSADTFVVTSDGVLNLEGLSLLIAPNQYRGAPVQLLTLSACETAAGDDRAALGLGGVALKAGARTALATLWCVNDRASTSLITDFYRAFHANHDSGKAISLQAAQLKLLHDPAMRQYHHPCYWAPFLIIGDWN